MPCITISRMYGAGGSEIAEIVAHGLKWTLYDNDMIDTIARRSGLSPSEVADTEERIPSLVERISGAFTLGTPEVIAGLPEGQVPSTEEEIIGTTKEIIKDALSHGPAVFVGRGAQCVLAERSDALHVFCHAPTPALVAYTKNKFGMTQKDAEKKVADMNKHREQYVKRYWNRSWLSPLNYHLSIDTAWFGLDRAAEMIVQGARKKFSL